TPQSSRSGRSLPRTAWRHWASALRSASVRSSSTLRSNEKPPTEGRGLFRALRPFSGVLRGRKPVGSNSTERFALGRFYTGEAPRAQASRLFAFTHRH